MTNDLTVVPFGVRHVASGPDTAQTELPMSYSANLDELHDGCRDRLADPPHTQPDPGSERYHGIGLVLFDAGYLSEDNLTIDGPDRLIALGKSRDRTNPTHGPAPASASEPPP